MHSTLPTPWKNLPHKTVAKPQKSYTRHRQKPELVHKIYHYNLIEIKIITYNSNGPNKNEYNT